jgi:hypothetical protein
MCAWPAGPARSSVLLLLARSGTTKEAHRRALNRSDGLLSTRSGAHLRRDPLSSHPHRPAHRAEGASTLGEVWKGQKTIAALDQGPTGQQRGSNRRLEGSEGTRGIVTNHEPDPASMAASTWAFPMILHSP